MNLPVIEHIKALYENVSLSRVCIIGNQHILETIHAMIRSLYSFGISPENISLLGKCYSTNFDVFRAMVKDGIDVSSYSGSFDSHSSFDEYFSTITRKVLQEKIKTIDFSHFEKVVILDDGGYLLSNALDLIDDPSNIVGVEQTTSGYEKIKHKEITFPIINVARSHAKLTYESPLIAEAVINQTLKKLKTLHRSPKKVLIIGGGAIGRALYEALRIIYFVELYDQDVCKTQMSEIDYKNSLSDYDMIIGSTGNVSVPKEYHSLLKDNVILLSVSSSDREFDAVYLRKNVPRVRNCHSDLEIHGKLLLNCGFPINFSGARHSVHPKKLQITLALLVAGILQGTAEENLPPKILSVNSESQNMIVKKYLECTSSMELVPVSSSEKI